jgi:hypothetical protein
MPLTTIEMLQFVPVCLAAAEPRQTALLAIAMAATLLLARLSPVRPTLCTIGVALAWTIGLIVFGIVRG